MTSPDYTRTASHLPPVYQDEQESYAQVDAFLGLLDHAAQAQVERLDDLPLTLGPDAALRWPAHLPLDAGADAVLDALLAQYDQSAQWAAYEFPGTWTRDEPGVAKRRTFLARSARLWRRLGTPHGFVDWFSLAFDVSDDQRPYLLEHFTIASAGIEDPELMATLLVPATPQFDSYRRRREAVDFVEAHAPAHVLVRVCWVPVDYTPPPAPEPPGPGANAAARTAYRTALAQYRSDLHGDMCEIASEVGHGLGFTLAHCPPSADGPAPDPDRADASDRLDLGLLTSESGPLPSED